MNKKIGLVVLGIIVLSTVFFAGDVYGKSKIPARGQGNQTFAFNTQGRGMRNVGGMGGFIGGEVISKDDKSITVKLQDGGSKIIFLSTGTKVSKQITGTVSDLAVGTEVSVTGAANADGSVNAETVQIRPSTAPVLK